MCLSRAALLPVGMWLLVACGQAPESFEQARSALLNGDPSGVDDNEVVKVVSKQDDMYQTLHNCTGTLIAPNLVLTARHCVVNTPLLPFSCTSDGELVKSSQGGRLGAAVPPADIAIHVGPELKTPVMAVGAKVFSTDSNTTCRNDIAVVLLDQEITDAPLAKIRLGAGVKRGEMLSVFGYGADENSMSGVRKRRDDIKVIQVGPSEFAQNPDPTPPRTFSTPGPVLCIGDSGGPSFGSQGEVVGVWSAVVGDCTSPDSKNVFTDVAPFESAVIRPAFEASGYAPLIAELPAETGEGGAGNVDAGGAPAEVGGSDPVGTGGTGGDEPEPDPEPVAGSAGTGGTKTTPRRKKDSGGCSTAPLGTSSSGALLLGAFGALVAWRRRRV